MAACAHGSSYASCPPDAVAKEFNVADAQTGILKKKIKAKGELAESIKSAMKKHGRA